MRWLLIRIYAVCHSACVFCETPLLWPVEWPKSKDCIVYLRKPGVNGLTGRPLLLQTLGLDVHPELRITRVAQQIFNSTGQRPAELMGWCVVCPFISNINYLANFNQTLPDCCFCWCDTNVSCFFRSSSNMATITKNSKNCNGLLLHNRLGNFTKISSVCWTYHSLSNSWLSLPSIFQYGRDRVQSFS